jgi:hypothetical protein
MGHRVLHVRRSGQFKSEARGRKVASTDVTEGVGERDDTAP